MPHTFTISGRWHAGYSLLGRWIERRAASRWHAGGLLIVALAAGTTALLLATTAAWMLDASAALTVLLILWIVFLAAGLAGYQPAIRIEVTGADESGTRRIILAQGTRRRTIESNAIEHSERLDPLSYHRLFRRDGITDCWVNDPTKIMLRIDIGTGDESPTLILGLPPNEHASFLNTLRRQNETLAARTADEQH